MIEVAAGRKECFFEDLHKNDKARVQFAISWTSCLTASSLSSDDDNVSGWGGRPPGHRFLGELRLLSNSFLDPTSL